MEELQSTEALDREILEDARKKAFKILKSADENIAASKLSWERRLAKDLEDLRKNRNARVEKSRREIMARLPMDKRRIQSEKIEGFLNQAMENFLASLDRKQLLAILERELARRMEECGVRDFEKADLRYRGLSREELASLLEKFFPSALPGAREDRIYTIPGSLPAVALDFPELRVSASVDAAAAQMLLDKRGELAAALLGDAGLENPTGQGGGRSPDGGRS